MIDTKLKAILGDELYAQVEAAVGANDQVNLVNASDGYVTQADHDAVKGQLAEANTKVETSAAAQRSLQDKVTQMETSQAELKASHQSELTTVKRDAAIDRYLIENGIRSLKSSTGWIDREKISLDENGNLTGLEEQMETLKNDAPYLFKDAGPSAAPVNPAPAAKQSASILDSMESKVNQLFQSNE